VTALFLLLAFLQPPPEAPNPIRDRMAALLGGLPEQKTPLNPQVLGRFERPGYRVEKIVFDSLPNFHVTADLYLPTQTQPPFPAVLGVAGHSDNGKASATYQHAWISLARRGFAVLAYDPPGQGERLEYFDPALGYSRVGAGVNEHIMAGLQCLLTGAPIARYFVWGGIRAVDYLTSRPDIDPRRIAVAGNSGGGTQAALLAVFEPRLAAVVSSCYITSWKELLAGPGPQDAEQILPGFLAKDLDFADYIRAFAPKPFLVTSATRDFFPIAGARATAKAVPNAEFFEYDDTHGWSKPRREAAYAFLDKHLLRLDRDAHEAPLVTEPESVLWVTPTGQLANSLGTESVFTLNRKLAETLYPVRKAVSLKDPNDLRRLVATRLWPSNPPIHSPAPVAPQPGPALLAIDIPEADLAPLRAAGLPVTAVTLEALPSGRGGYTGAYQAAAREWLFNGSLPSKDVALVWDAWEQASGHGARPVGLWGKGNRAGVAALLTAALEPRVAAVLAEKTLTSYYAATQSYLHNNLAEVVIPGVLADFDLPDLVPLIAPRPLWLMDPATPTGAKSMATEYPRAWVRLLERPEGWPSNGFLGGWFQSWIRP